MGVAVSSSLISKLELILTWDGIVSVVNVDKFWGVKAGSICRFDLKAIMSLFLKIIEYAVESDKFMLLVIEPRDILKLLPETE